MLYDPNEGRRALVGQRLAHREHAAHLRERVPVLQRAAPARLQFHSNPAQERTDGLHDREYDSAQTSDFPTQLENSARALLVAPNPAQLILQGRGRRLRNRDAEPDGGEAAAHACRRSMRVQSLLAAEVESDGRE